MMHWPTILRLGVWRLALGWVFLTLALYAWHVVTGPEWWFWSEWQFENGRYCAAGWAIGTIAGYAWVWRWR